MSIDNICKYLDLYENKFYNYSHEEHLNRWLSQFSGENVSTIIDELSNIFDKCFITKEIQEKFLNSVLKQEELINSLDGFDNTTILNIQKQGNSQKIYSSRLQQLFNTIYDAHIPINDFNKINYIYVDDFSFSGIKLRYDIIDLLKNVGENKKIICIFIGIYTNSAYYNKKIFSEKNINCIIYRFFSLENRKGYINNSDIFCPSENIKRYSSVQDYLSTLDQEAVFRSSHNMTVGQKEIFTSIEKREIIENEFLLAGLNIINQTGTEIQPLGVSAFKGLGFGSTIFSYRNTPNNCPICLWWGNPVDQGGLGNWYPLLMRKVYD